MFGCHAIGNRGGPPNFSAIRLFGWFLLICLQNYNVWLPEWRAAMTRRFSRIAAATNSAEAGLKAKEFFAWLLYRLRIDTNLLCPRNEMSRGV